MSNQIDDETRV